MIARSNALPARRAGRVVEREAGRGKLIEDRNVCPEGETGARIRERRVPLTVRRAQSGRRTSPPHAAPSKSAFFDSATAHGGLELYRCVGGGEGGF